MTQRRLIALFILIAIVAMGAGIALQQSMNGKGASNKPTIAAIGDKRPAFTLTDTEGQQRQISEWDGKVILLNFWATWCPPCRREIPAFVRLQEDYADKGFTVVGVAIDKKDDVVEYINGMLVNYPVMVSELEGVKISKAYGNRLSVLPYTVIIDRNGKIHSTHRTELSYEGVEALIKPLL